MQSMIKEVETEREIVFFGRANLPDEVSHQAAELQKSTVEGEQNLSILNMSLQPQGTGTHFTV